MVSTCHGIADDRSSGTQYSCSAEYDKTIVHAGADGPWTEYFAHQAARDQQDRFMRDAYLSLQDGQSIVAEAPTGLGKTAASLSSALSVMRGKEGVDKLLFLTGRQSQHRIVIDTLRELNRKVPAGTPEVTVVDLIGRESMCGNLTIDRKCFCEEGQNEKALGARRSFLRRWILSEPRHAEETIRNAKVEGVCPYACSIEAAREAEVIVLDYNHVFVESVSESSLSSMSIDLQSSSLIIDEAHNLPDRIKMGLELRLTVKMIKSARYEVEEYKENLEKNKVGHEDIAVSSVAISCFKRIEEEVSSWMATKMDDIDDSEHNDILVEASDLVEVIKTSFLSSLTTNDWSSTFREFSILLGKVTIDDSDGEEETGTSCLRFLAFLETILRFEKSDAMALVFDLVGDEGRVTSCLLDPAVISSTIISKAKGSVLMSGTLHPTSMYGDMLGLTSGSYEERAYSSPFAQDRRPIIICSDVTSKYTKRGKENLKRIRSHVKEVLDQTPGNVAVFAPSYAMMSEIIETTDWIPKAFRIKDEESGMSKSDVSKVIRSLTDSRTKTVLFGVMGGRFSEGVDYSGGILSAVVAVGLPVPPPSSRQRATIEYMSKRYGRDKGWRYSSGQPAVNSVLQAIGRPIRKEDDRAILVLLENRFLERTYSRLLPKNIITIPSADSDVTGRLVRRFFSRYP